MRRRLGAPHQRVRAPQTALAACPTYNASSQSREMRATPESRVIVVALNATDAPSSTKTGIGTSTASTNRPVRINPRLQTWLATHTADLGSADPTRSRPIVGSSADRQLVFVITTTGATTRAVVAIAVRERKPKLVTTRPTASGSCPVTIPSSHNHAACPCPSPDHADRLLAMPGKAVGSWCWHQGMRHRVTARADPL